MIIRINDCMYLYNYVMHYNLSLLDNIVRQHLFEELTVLDMLSPSISQAIARISATPTLLFTTVLNIFVFSTLVGDVLSIK